MAQESKSSVFTPSMVAWLTKEFSPAQARDTSGKWTAAAASAASKAKEASKHAQKASNRARSPKHVGVGARRAGEDQSVHAMRHADEAIERNKQAKGRGHTLGQHHSHEQAAYHHEAARREHHRYSDEAFARGQHATGMLHSQAATAHQRAAEAHHAATETVKAMAIMETK
jgi:hypothetical protein